MANSIPDIEFVRLSDVPDLVPDCAHFHAALSIGDGAGERDEKAAMDMRKAAFRKLALDGEEEDAVVGLISSGFRTGQIVAIAVLVKSEMEAFEDLGPWLAAPLVDPAIDHGSLIDDLCAEVEELADEMGYSQIFVQSSDAKHYKALGYSEIEPFTKDDREHWVLGKAL
ncbi:hypothetical protein SAMN04515647_3026 [Cohaesibacter sp. ES.047]|uniref:hypothetical protein n=1 Tax=Cohaesibacter sp. ES.047 TaxID=1798205 RepID=UPI000BB6B23F|nr:hypothetical protein [Cohaesibacter sp. ES.047]SNY92757.1 hypothetical protein SAMN04515647_3026 [Cohaesibacter sp. ES.047]